MFMIDIDTPSHYGILGVSPMATAAQIRRARDVMVNELRNEGRGAPERKAELTAQAQVINAAAEELLRLDQREKYDREHPDLRVFTRRSAAAPLFIDPGQRVAVLHRAIVEHLARSGVRSRPPSDLHRTDFGPDHTLNPLLDELIAQRRR